MALCEDLDENKENSEWGHMRTSRWEPGNSYMKTRENVDENKETCQ